MNAKEQLDTIRYVRRGAAHVAKMAIAAAEAEEPVNALTDLIRAREDLDRVIGALHRYKGAVEVLETVGKTIPDSRG